MNKVGLIEISHKSSARVACEANKLKERYANTGFDLIIEHGLRIPHMNLVLSHIGYIRYEYYPHYTALQKNCTAHNEIMQI